MMLLDFSEKQSLVLAVNLEKTHLVIGRREHTISDNENDRSTSNFSEILLKVSDITRLEVGREKSSKKGTSSPKLVTTFTIVMRKPVAGFGVFNFEAESLSERDRIIAGIKCVLELTKFPSSESRRTRLSSSPIFPEMKSRAVANDQAGSFHEVHTKGQDSKTFIEKRDDIAVSAAVYFDFNLPSDGPDAAIEAEMRIDDHNRDCRGERDDPAGSDSDRDTDGRAVVPVDKATGGRTSMAVKKGNWSIDSILCGMALAANPSTESSSPSNAEQALHGKIGAIVNNFDGCNSIKALAAVQDVDLSKIGFNEVSTGPFCTDDLCTATFKDLADSMKGAFVAKVESNGMTPPAMGNGFVSVVLGAPTTVAANFLSVTEIFTNEPQQAKPKPPKGRSLQNRSRKLGAQATRLSCLRRQMTFDALIEHMPYVQVVNSYDDIERSDRFGRKVKSVDLAKGPRAESSRFLQTVINNMEQDNGAESEGEILYYDSDPEDAREIALRRGPRRALANLENKSARTSAPREALSEIPMSRINMRRKLKNVDDETISEIIESMKNEKMTLIWHPADSIKATNKAPFCSKVWIEAGIYLVDGTFLLPKLTWVPVSELNIQRRVLNATTRRPGTIDLLDVCRVRECKSVDRKLYPFANAECSFMVQTQTETQLFEARSRDERIRVVNALRLVIARLASLLMLRDLRAVDEFFGGNSVPGEAPAWAKGRNENGDSGAAH